MKKDKNEKTNPAANKSQTEKAYFLFSADKRKRSRAFIRTGLLHELWCNRKQQQETKKKPKKKSADALFFYSYDFIFIYRYHLNRKSKQQF